MHVLDGSPWLLVLVLSALVLLCVAGLTLLVLRRSSPGPPSEAEVRLAARLDQLRSALEAALRETGAASARGQTDFALQLASRLQELKLALLGTLESRFDRLHSGQAEALSLARQEQSLALDGVRDRLASELGRMRLENEAKLEQIRATVDERLQSTLESRLGRSFQLVSERLEQVHKGLGEMQSLASGVGDLKRILTNIRSRGAFGEAQLEALLEQVLTPGQYDRNVATVPGSPERVEFAVRLPGRDPDGCVVRLPIDAKFPQEDYQRLQDAYEAGDRTALAVARRSLRARLLDEAAKIRSKYLAPPHTTDFALLFLATEGLYAEALRLPGVLETLQRECRVVLVGPATLYAVLNSLQMGFRTLAIERRASEVWAVLSAVKTEFAKFGKSLEDVKKKLQEASSKIEFSEQRSRAVERKLRAVETLPEGSSELFEPESS